MEAHISMSARKVRVYATYHMGERPTLCFQHPGEMSKMTIVMELEHIEHVQEVLAEMKAHILEGRALRKHWETLEVETE